MLAKALLALALATAPCLSTANPPGAAAATPDCQPQTSIAVATIKPQIILVGETHGTEQAPAFVGGLVCSLLKAHRPVILALERGGEEQRALNRFLDSTDIAADRKALLQTGAWAWAIQDGRSSQAMLALIDTMRQLRRAGQRVSVLAMRRDLAMSVPRSAGMPSTPLAEADLEILNDLNDRGMADALAIAAAEYRDHTIVALAGSTHTATRAWRGAAPGYQPMAQVLTASMPAFVIGLTTAEGGKSWNCYSATDCAAHASSPGAMYQQDTQIDAEVQLGKLTASPPAKTGFRPSPE